MRSQRALLFTSLIVSFAAAGLAFAAYLNSRRAEARAYQRVVDDTWQLMQPLYEDFGLARPTVPPATLKQSLVPLFRAASTLQGTP